MNTKCLSRNIRSRMRFHPSADPAYLWPLHQYFTEWFVFLRTFYKSERMSHWAH